MDLSTARPNTPRRRGRPPKPKLPPPTDVLIVEDDLELAELFAAELKQVGYDARTTGTVRQALEDLRLRRPRLVFLDLTLADGTGEDVVSQAQAQGLVLPPIYVVTASRDPRRVAACRALGALYKPNVTIEMVSAIADRMLGVPLRQRHALVI